MLSRDTLTDVVVALAQGTHLTKTAAHKLSYLIDTLAIDETGRPVLGLEFRHTDYGMWSPDLADIIRDAVDSGRLKAQGVHANVGEGAVFHAPSGDLPQLPSELRGIVDEALSRFGSMQLSRLIVTAKSTSPFIYSREGEWVDWNMAIEEHCKGEHVLT